MAPLDNPRYLVLVLLDEPMRNQYGGIIAAPVFQKVVSRTMAYQGQLPEEKPQPAVADARDVKTQPKSKAALAKLKQEEAAKKREEAARKKQELAGKGKKGKSETRIAAAAGPTVMGRGAEEVRREVTENVPAQVLPDGIPSVVGLSVRRAVENFAQRGMVPVIKGAGNTVVRQSPAAGAPLPGKSGPVECTLWLGEQPS
jgi:cell division protein FtsI (penicillin-binding protein 3)